jgi:hypothetical protein
MRLSRFCFITASLMALLGMSIGIFMGVSEDHTLGPVHAHLNLLGWVSTFLFGLYHRIHEEEAGRLAQWQVGLWIAGYAAMLSSLAIIRLTGDTALLPVAILGSLLLVLGMGLFAVLVWRSSPERIRTAAKPAR